MSDDIIVTEIWIETSSDIFPDFIAHDKGKKDYERIPQDIYIKVQEDLKKLKKSEIGASWNKYAWYKFFNKVNTSLFSNVSAFQVLFNGKFMPPKNFRELWERKISELIK